MRLDKAKVNNTQDNSCPDAIVNVEPLPDRLDTHRVHVVAEYLRNVDDE